MHGINLAQLSISSLLPPLVSNAWRAPEYIIGVDGALDLQKTLVIVTPEGCVWVFFVWRSLVHGQHSKYESKGAVSCSTYFVEISSKARCDLADRVKGLVKGFDNLLFRGLVEWLERECRHLVKRTVSTAFSMKRNGKSISETHMRAHMPFASLGSQHWNLLLGRRH